MRTLLGQCHSKESLVTCVTRLFSITELPPETSIQVLRSPEWSIGPNGTTRCNPHQRQVYLGSPEHYEIREAFHELVHCIVQPPGFTIQVDECIWLIQFEEALAKALATPREFQSILNWHADLIPSPSLLRMESDIPGCRARLGSIPNYRTMGFYVRGQQDLVCMGALDEEGRPTGQYPDWSKSPYQDRLMEMGYVPVSTCTYPDRMLS